ncbi:hypothetical protein T11_1750 [Trichinella zimbabwensis]|uniref:Uncharacterized protein n=1 Tax=Trichinella zimbabwensis TaxID=268475 RepID=A0A0V1GKZ4_9BILA|nr:hypothetical protein T11_1750 [Trichinella zimbabwensis]
MNAVVRDRWDYGDKTGGWKGCWVGEGVKREASWKNRTRLSDSQCDMGE